MFSFAATVFIFIGGVCLGIGITLQLKKN